MKVVYCVLVEVAWLAEELEVAELEELVELGELELELELIAEWTALSADWTRAGPVLLSQLLPEGTTKLPPTLEPENPLSPVERDPSELTIWVILEAMDWS
jgi:hypothetical protein